ncbi:alpha/beta hydrolase [Clostridium sardiniense]|uniref:alpha/beta hydrolase n=1 Tax=Clostridium sardiniense TaxID=29369 RepID=UPI00195B5E57|nr:alpha/beta hydrolase-fold protein [Clostridium sardiniense]MBM7836264.1 S-formylglutathione hydrolase FrmB [Clostridium sardiniense]
MILRGNVFSKILEMDTGITVIVPNGFKESNKYKVAYVLHGLCGDNGSWADNTMLPVYANNYNTIFIMLEVARSFYTDMKYGQRFFSYITEELPEICKRVFKISHKREDTAIIGGSMGGYGALKCALSKPEEYGYCCAFSSACLFLKDDLDRQRKNDKTEELKAMYGEQLITDFLSAFGQELECNPQNEILELAKSVSVQEIKPKIYLACGTEDYLRDYNIRFRNEIEKINLNFTYEEWEGVHDWYFFNEALKKALQFCFEN